MHGDYDTVVCVTVHLESDTRMVDMRTVRADDRFDVSIVRNPAEIRVVALLKKEKEGRIDVQVDRVGFTIPDEFVIGYGLDYAGKYRNLPYVAVLDERAISGG